MVVRLLAVAVAVAACSRDVSIADRVCGNWVLDPGEDCDRPDATCTATCRIACDPDAPTTCSAADALDGKCCPSGMACGRDDVCHAPTGTLQASAITEPIAYTSLRTGDIDGDHLDDVIAGLDRAVSVGYGDPAAPLARTTTTLAPALTQNAEIGFGDLDGDGRPDIAIPTAGGLFAFEEATGAPAAVAFPADVAQGRVHERLAYIGDAPLLGFLLEYDLVPAHDPAASNFQLQVVQTPSISSKEVYLPYDTQPSLCGLDNDLSITAAVRGRALHPYLDGATARLPLTLGTTSVGICVATLDPNHGGAPSYAIPKSVFGTHTPVTGDGETFFANLLSAGCPELVVPCRDANQQYATMILRGVGTTGACQVDPLPQDAQFLPGLPLAAIAYAPLPNPSSTTPGLITSIGVYAFPGPTLVDAATREWRYAVVRDLDGDGRQDFATAGTGADVEVFRQAPYFELSDFVIPTSGVVERIALGNFDGDKAGDVAFATSDPGMPGGPTELTVAWGDADGTFTTADVGAVDALDDVVMAQLQDPALPPLLDQNDDLVVARAGGDGSDPADPTRLVDEYGSTGRVFTAPFVYTSTFSDPGASTTPVRAFGVGAQIAAFDGPTPQVLALFADDPNLKTTYNTALVELTPSSDGSFVKTAEGLLSLCGPPVSADTPFCWASAHWITIPRSGGALLLGLRADVVGGAQTQCAEYYLGGRGPLGLTPLSCAALAPAAAGASDPDTQAAYAGLTGTRNVHPVDYAGSIVHVTVASGPFHEGHAFVWALTVGPSGQPQLDSPVALDAELARSGALPAGRTASCSDATELELGTREIAGTSYGDGARELVVACSVPAAAGHDTQLWARYADPGGGAPHYELLRDLGADLDVHLRTGDFDGNGLPDLELAAANPETGARQVMVLLQCDAHQTGCTGGS